MAIKRFHEVSTANTPQSSLTSSAPTSASLTFNNVSVIYPHPLYENRSLGSYPFKDPLFNP